MDNPAIALVTQTFVTQAFGRWVAGEVAEWLKAAVC
jgi:hypothetical protein